MARHREITIHLPRPHPKQREFISNPAKRKIIRAGRRGGKTVGISIFAVENFLAGKRILYATPTQEQIDRFWATCTRALDEAIANNVYYKNETKHIIELPGTEQRIRAKTAWNADTLRGDYADILILDEYQLMDETAWSEVGAPMLLDNNGDAVFIYTPPSRKSRSTIKARDRQHAPKMFKKAEDDKSGRWATFHFSSLDNPHLSREALDEIAIDMTALTYKQEILAEDVTEVPGALWKQTEIDEHRVDAAPELVRVVVAIDPAGSSKTGSDDTGIIVAGKGVDGRAYILADRTCHLSPAGWGGRAVVAYHEFEADRVVAETNFGGEMVEHVIATTDPKVPYKDVHASRGKQVRAEPIAAMSEKGKVSIVGDMPELEEELTSWVPGDPSPNRLDAMVWALTELMLGDKGIQIF